MMEQIKGFKTYILLGAMMILAAVEQFTGVTIPSIVYEVMGLGAGVTAKMAIDRMASEIGKKNASA